MNDEMPLGPKKPEDEEKDKLVNLGVLVTREEKRQVRQAAAKKGQTMSAWARATLRR